MGQIGDGHSILMFSHSSLSGRPLGRRRRRRRRRFRRLPASLLESILVDRLALFVALRALHHSQPINVRLLVGRETSRLAGPLLQSTFFFFPFLQFSHTSSSSRFAHDERAKEPAGHLSGPLVPPSECRALRCRRRRIVTLALALDKHMHKHPSTRLVFVRSFLLAPYELEAPDSAAPKSIWTTSFFLRWPSSSLWLTRL